MCSYVTVRSEIDGSGKGAKGWFHLSHVLAYFDHPFHAAHGHTLNLDFVNDKDGPSARVAVELSAESARQLVRCIEEALAAAGDAAA